MKKILEVIRQGEIGGGESHVIDLAENIDRKHYCLVFLSFTAGPMVERIKQMGFSCYVIHSEKPFDWKVWKDVSKLVRQEKIEIIHAHGTRALSNCFYSAKKCQTQLIYTIHGWSFHDYQGYIRKKISIWVEEYLIRKTKISITVSKKNDETGRKYIKNFKSVLIQNGVNLNRFSSNGSFHDVRKEFGISEEVTLVGYIARITKQKDPHTLIKAIEILYKKSPNIKFLIIGEGDLKKEIIQIIKQSGLESAIYFDDFRQDIPDVLNAIDIYCLPSLWEGLSIGILEAMAMKKAIIATAVDGTVELLQNNRNGLLISTKSPDLLAEGILKLHNNKNLIKDFGGNAFETVKSSFTVAKMVSEVEKVYSSIM